jgi:ketosteroid isomerase-like protein
MSRENVEAFRSAIDAVNRLDIDAALPYAAPDVVFIPLRAAVSGAYHGHEGIRQWAVDTDESFDVFRIDLTDVRDLGDDVLALGTLRVRGKGGGVEMDVPTAGIAKFENGLLVKWEDFGDRRKALHAAGLQE